MAPTGGFANSTGIDFSPPSPVDYSSGPSPTSPVMGARSKEAALASKSFNKPPPTAPRSMRPNISPPPLRRAETFRDSGPRPLDRYEPYTNSRRRYSDEFRRPERAPVSDNYHPLSPRRRDVSWEDARTRLSPRGDKYDRHTETVRMRRDSVTKYHLEPLKEAVEADSAGSARPATKTNSVVGASKDAHSKAREAARLVAEKINQNVKTSSPLSAHDTRSGQARKSHEDENLLRDVGRKRLEGDCVESRATKQGMQNGLALPHPEMRLGIPSHHEACAPRSDLPSDVLRPRYSIIPDDACDEAEPVESIEKESQVQPHEGGSFPKPPMKEAPRPSREGSWSIKPASTPSTGTAGSRNKNICRACRKPGSTVTPLVPCKICRKGYREFPVFAKDCPVLIRAVAIVLSTKIQANGDPQMTAAATQSQDRGEKRFIYQSLSTANSYSDRLEDFVCGRCLKKQEAAAAKDEAGRNNLDKYSPSDALPVVHTPPLPVQSHIPAITSNSTLPGLTKEGESSRSSLDRYSPTDALVLDNPQLPIQSQIAAPLTSSSLPELNVALLARQSRETKISHDSAEKIGQTANSNTLKHGKVVNGGVESTAKLTDQAKGPNHPPVLTIKPPSGPRNASSDNLSQIPNPMTASKAASLRDQYKQITCPSLRRGGCWLIEEHCVFAHKDTGRAAPNSNTDAKDFTCPDFAAGRCAWLMRECKYAHYDTGLYVGLDGKASLKHITCWYWKIKGHCIKNEENCLYAHEETGLLSWQPNADSQKRGGGANSLKDFICPRFEDGDFCVYEQRGNCPYTHSMFGKSCLAQYRLERPGNRRYSGFDGHASPPGPPAIIAEPSARDCAVQVQLAPAMLAEKAEALESVLITTREGRSLAIQQQLEPRSGARLTPPSALNTQSSRGPVEQVAEMQIAQQVATGPNGEQETVLRDTSQATLQYSTAQTSSQSMTEQQPPRARGSKFARRGGLGLRPSLFRTKLAPTHVKKTSQSEHDFPVAELPLHAAEIDSPNSNVYDARGAAASSGSIERKKCEGCPKTIYSSGTLCQTCAKKPENQYRTDETVAKCPTVDTPKPGTPLSIEIPDDILGSPHLGALTTDPGSVTSGASYQESSGLLGRKRPANDDHLFVAAKRRRNSQTARDAAIALLRQERRAASGGVPAEINTEGLSSLGDLANLAIEERMPSERKSTEETSTMIASVRQSSFDNLSRQVSFGSPSNTSPKPPIASPSEFQTNYALKLPPQGLHKRARRSSSIGSTAKSSVDDENVEIPQIVSTAEIESPDNGREAQPVLTEAVAERPAPDKDDFTAEEHELFVDAYILHPKMFDRIAESLPGRTIQACIRHFLATGGRIYYQDLVEKAAHREEEESKQKNNQRAARKHAPAPGMQLQAKRPTGESDDSSIQDGDEDDEQEMTLGKVVERRDAKPEAWVNRSPARTPAPTDQTASPVQSASVQPHSAQVHQTPTSSPGQSAARSQPMPRCPRCKDTHKRCWHKMDGSPDPLKCELFVQHYGPQGPSWIKPKDWKEILEAANQAMLEKFTAKNGNNESKQQNTTTDVMDGDDKPDREDSSPLTPLTQAGHEEDDDEDDVRPLSEIRFTSSSSTRVPRSLKSTTPKTVTKNSSDMSLAKSNLVTQLDKGPKPSFSPLTTFADSPDVSRTATEGEQTVCSKEDDARALQRLKDRHPGIIFDTESEDEVMEDDYFQPPPPTRVDALWQRPNRSRNLFDIEPSYDMADPANRLAAEGLLPSSTRPSKKQLMGGKLLLYQCAERKKRFGNPHQEVRRYPKAVMVTTTVQRDIDFDNSQEVRAKTEKVIMTFREFLGAPKDPVIEARKDQLVFREKEAVQQVAGRHGRARRILENEVFPFVYSGNAK